MTLRIVATLIASALISLLAAHANRPLLIPEPSSIEHNEGLFTITSSSTISVSSEELRPIADYLSHHLGLSITTAQGDIHLATDSALQREEYSLCVSQSSISLHGGSYGGVFNGVTTLLQLLPAEAYSCNVSYPATLQCMTILDKPRFEHRGFMLDVCRTWIDKDAVMEFIDLLAYHKINSLRLHLTDDEAWRIEIKSHPELATIGGFRGGDSPIWPRYGKWNERWGGYYTQEDMAEIIEYARIRNIEIIPEIDLPGHSLTMATMHPEILCRYTPNTSSAFGYDTRSAFCASKQSNYELLADILGEICQLFPCEYIHIGGDEVDMSQWKRCPDCSAWLKNNGYTDGYKLEDMFIGRVQAILAKYGKNPSVWNEAAFGGGLSKKALVHGWKSAQVCKQVMMKGYRTIFMPQEFFYLDMRQSKHETGAVWGGCFDVRKTYSFDFAKEGFTPEEVATVEGFEAPYWSEVFLSQGGDKSIDFIEFMTFPRLCALAEHGWGKNGGGEWEEFHTRLYTRHYDRMVDMGINFRITPSEVKYENGLLSVEKVDNGTIFYREDGSEKVCRYTDAIHTEQPGKYLFWAEYRGAKTPDMVHPSRYNTLKPKVTLTSSVPENPKYGYSRASDYDTNMRTARTCQKGDWFLFEFDEPVECRSIEFASGNAAVPSSLIPVGYLEVSEDGKSFERVADLVSGAAKLENPKPIKAARIVVEAPYLGTTAITLRSPIIYPKW